MTITHFSTLPITEQLELLYDEGVHLGKRYVNGFPVILCQFGKWYVEIFYEKYRCEASHTCCTASTDILYPYLDEISLDELFN